MKDDDDHPKGEEEGLPLLQKKTSQSGGNHLV
jgi:hypothetical protein